MRTAEDKLAKARLKDGGCKPSRSRGRDGQVLGGKVDAFYYAFRDSDVFVIIDGPDNAVAITAEVRSAGTPRLVWEVML